MRCSFRAKLLRLGKYRLGIDLLAIYRTFEAVYDLAVDAPVVPPGGLLKSLVNFRWDIFYRDRGHTVLYIVQYDTITISTSRFVKLRVENLCR